ncbi:outer membrane protein assembly factor BamA [Methylovulum psychrotolerans]|uniref:Outer membrane protein assembly factor BamA n=1 Tax=Methylovulum psychrotolerans TaxID=1704499 RepID=A0A1Z4C156_9GAMM|nr:outer membrane protein assembly factor BamA [Methylovulum psychrotolerans]ASF47264.1 outer membrane protein assembly factor BamA [Methylovulum psychrotolerans]POZ52171.1 outer membrane protein assembly factor BamA [Methylovulum psychrotolerans]
MKLHPFSRWLLLGLLVSQAVKSDGEFVVSDIKVTGLQRISLGTVYNYLPVNVGERFSQEKVAPAIRALFKTGFFKDITLERQGNTLMVKVIERPSIAKIIFEGNKDLSKDDLKKALDKIGLSEGKIFDRQVLDKVEQELNRQYLSHGKYGLKIKTEVANLTRNRVGITINISEGKVAKIKQINIVGNQAFDDKTLLGTIELSTSNWLSFYSKDDQYSKQKLAADLETLRSYYLDRGYINFAIESTQVAITPDKKDIYVTINVKEGAVYTVEKVKLAGNLIAPPEELIKLVGIGPGEVFSRKSATETSKAISDRLGNDGYAFANVNMVPDVNEANKTVDMTFFVDPGKRAYVHQINMSGNTKTRDEVLRREMRQMESSWASSAKIERSKTRLERLGYFESVNVETPPVVGTNDQIDVNFGVTEKASGNLSAGVGFSQVQGIVFNANISQDNVFGSGKRVNIGFNNSSYLTSYQLGFFNPYFTKDGVSVGYTAGYTKRNAGQINIANYSTEVLNAGMDFGIPLNEFDQVRFGLEGKHTQLSTTVYSSQQISSFINNQGNSFLTVSPTLSWTHDTLNRAIFPSKGGQQRLTGLITAPGSDLEYYKVGYKHQLYFPLAKDFTFRIQAEAAYGHGYGKTSALPFFENYYGGGTGSVRGYRNNSLGPRDSNGYPLGGSSKIIGNAELFFPVPFLSDVKSVRLGAFMDAGTISNAFTVNNLKYAAGLSGEWLSPFGALSISVAQPLKTGTTTYIDNNGNAVQVQDQSQLFQFNFGQNF